MDLLTIGRTLWSHRIATVVVAVLTGLGVYYVAAVVPPTYESSASVLLVSPRAAPSSDDVRADPSLADVNADNPYTRSYDPAVVIGVVATRIELREEALRDAGVEDFSVLPTNQYGFASPVVEIATTAATPEVAERSAILVLEAFEEELFALQDAEGVDPTYMVDTRTVEAPQSGTEVVSGKLRAAIAVLGLGVIGLFMVVSTLDGLATVRAQRRERRAEGTATDSTATDGTTNDSTAHGDEASEPRPFEHVLDDGPTADVVPLRRPAARVRIAPDEREATTTPALLATQAFLDVVARDDDGSASSDDLTRTLELCRRVGQSATVAELERRLLARADRAV